MNEEILWGLLVVVYIVPFWLWQMSVNNTFEIRKELYPGRSDEVVAESRFNRAGLLWCVGLLAMVGAWYAGWHPLAVALLMAGAIASLWLWKAAKKRRHLIHDQLVRLWLAGSIVWALGVGGWFVIFSRLSELTNKEYFYLALFPPLLAATAIFAWRWARKKS